MTIKNTVFAILIIYDEECNYYNTRGSLLILHLFVDDNNTSTTDGNLPGVIHNDN